MRAVTTTRLQIILGTLITLVHVIEGVLVVPDHSGFHRADAVANAEVEGWLAASDARECLLEDDGLPSRLDELHDPPFPHGHEACLICKAGTKRPACLEAVDWSSSTDPARVALPPAPGKLASRERGRAGPRAPPFSA